MKMMKYIAATMMMMLFAQLSYANMMTDAKQQKMQTKMNEMATVLKITDAQKPVWDAYTSTVMKNAQMLADEKTKMKTARQGGATKVKGQGMANTAMERFDQQINFEKMKIKAIEDQKSAFSKLYDKLDASQKKIADQRIKVLK